MCVRDVAYCPATRFEAGFAGSRPASVASSSTGRSHYPGRRTPCLLEPKSDGQPTTCQPVAENLIAECVNFQLILLTGFQLQSRPIDGRVRTICALRPDQEQRPELADAQARRGH